MKDDSPNVGGRPRNPRVRHEFMRQRREQAKKSRDQLRSDMRELGCSISATSLYNWERGESNPDPVRLAGWCAALKVRKEEALDS